MFKPMLSIINNASIKNGETINVLSLPPQPTDLIPFFFQDNIHFYIWEDQAKPFVGEIFKGNPSVTVIDTNKQDFPFHIAFNCILCYELTKQYNFAANIANSLHIPVVLMESNKPKFYFDQGIVVFNKTVVDLALFRDEEVMEKWTQKNKHLLVSLNKPKLLEIDLSNLYESLMEVIKCPYTTLKIV